MSARQRAMRVDARIVGQGLEQILQVGQGFSRLVGLHQQLRQAHRASSLSASTSTARRKSATAWSSPPEIAQDAPHPQRLAVVRRSCEPGLDAFVGLPDPVEAQQTDGPRFQDQWGGGTVLPDAHGADGANDVHAPFLSMQQRTFQDEVLVVLAAHRLVLVQELPRFVIGPDAACGRRRQEQSGRVVRPDFQVRFEYSCAGPLWDFSTAVWAARRSSQPHTCKPIIQAPKPIKPSSRTTAAVRPGRRIRKEAARMHRAGRAANRVACETGRVAFATWRRGRIGWFNAWRHHGLHSSTPAAPLLERRVVFILARLHGTLQVAFCRVAVTGGNGNVEFACICRTGLRTPPWRRAAPH